MRSLTLDLTPFGWFIGNYLRPLPLTGISFLIYGFFIYIIYLPDYVVVAYVYQITWW
jgi:hypothetical protein